MDKLTTQGNFYPMPSYMYLQDTTARVTLLSGQALGVSSRERGMTSLPPSPNVSTSTVTLQVSWRLYQTEDYQEMTDVDWDME